MTVLLKLPPSRVIAKLAVKIDVRANVVDSYRYAFVDSPK